MIFGEDEDDEGGIDEAGLADDMGKVYEGCTSSMKRMMSESIDHVIDSQANHKGVL